MEFTGKLGKYKIIETEDQTKTVWSEYFDENCHNLSGAKDETFHNYILGCEIPDQITKECHVLDVGFGVGVGLSSFIESLETLKNNDSKSALHSYLSIELDEDFFLWTIGEFFKDLSFEKKAFGSGFFLYTAMHPKYHFPITILIGDGRKTLPEYMASITELKWTAIFQDAFSPKKNPTLWTVEWFNFLRSYSAINVRLTTYSSSISIRKSLLKAGWNILSLKGFGMKRTMTKAFIDKESDSALLNDLARSPILELYDV